MSEETWSESVVIEPDANINTTMEIGLRPGSVEQEEIWALKARIEELEALVAKLLAS